MHPSSGPGRLAPGARPARTAPPGASLARLAAQQDGLFTRSQALACGFSAGQLRRRLRSGRWKVLLGPVLAPAGVRPSPDLRDLAALLAVPGSVLGGPSAARRHGIPVPGATTCLIVPPGTRVRLPGVRLLCEEVPSCDLVAVAGRPVTAVARTVFDCLRILPDDDARDLLALARTAAWITGDQLAERLHQFAGRRGAKRLARLCRLRAADADAPAQPGRVLLFETDQAAVEVVSRAARERDIRPAGAPAACFRPADLRERPDLVLLTLRSWLEGPG